MSVIQNNLLLAGDDAYNLTRSLRFRSSASAYLSRTPASAGNRKTWTFSTWLKKSSNGGGVTVFGSDYGDPYTNNYCHIGYISSTNVDALWVDCGNENIRGIVYTNAVFRDPSAWYHVVVVLDTTQATNTNRIKIYVNGVQQTCSTLANGYPQQNWEGLINTAGGHAIGYRMRDNNGYFNGYLTETNFIDGQALTPSSFGESNAQTGVWQPKRYAGTYGTNGFYLPFTDNSALTSGSNAGLGKDFSGNGNYWNTNNISITAGSTYDSMTDVPTLTSATAANFATWNGAAVGADGTLTNGNLDIAYGTSATRSGTAAPFGMTSGKWYWEVTITASGASPCNAMIGISTKSSPNEIGTYVGVNSNGWSYFGANGNATTNDVGTSYGNSYTTNDVIGVAFDADTGKLYFAKNNTWQNSGSPTSGTNPAFSSLTNAPYFPAIGDGSSGFSLSVSANFGQRPFAYTPPTGYVALNTFNLPTPTIGATASTQANKYFDANLWTGTGSARSITNSGFKPAFVWAKSRSAGYDHVLDDSVRGAGLTLISNSTGAEVNEGTSGLTSFDTSGFSIGGASGGWNSNTGATYVGWQWRGSDSSAVSNTAGSITSTVSANTSAGFSVVTYTGNGSASTVGHGLGVAPKMIIVKNRSAVESWRVGHASMNGGSSPWNYYMNLNATAAQGASSSVWNNTAPTSSVFSIANDSAVNGNTQTHVAYCFAEVAGYSKFGSYTGNFNADGVFIYTGFRPKFVMLKCSGDTGNWNIVDASRNTYNVVNSRLFPSNSNSENTAAVVDFLSNGFKIRSSDSDFNYTVQNIYAAFAETPFKYSLAR